MPDLRTQRRAARTSGLRNQRLELSGALTSLSLSLLDLCPLVEGVLAHGRGPKIDIWVRGFVELPIGQIERRALYAVPVKGVYPITGAWA